MKTVVTMLLLVTNLLISSPTIVMLLGSGSAGKTTLSKVLLQELGTNWGSIDEDDIYIDLWLSCIQEMFPQEYAKIEKAIAPCNRFHAIKRNEIIYKEIDVTLCKEAEKSLLTIQRYFINEKNIEIFRDEFNKRYKIRVSKELYNSLAKGKNIILDAAFSTPHQVKAAFPQARVLSVLVFTPLLPCCEHLKKRNEEAYTFRNLYGKRFYKYVIPSFVNLYRLTPQATEQTVAVHAKEDIEQLFEEISKEVRLYNEPEEYHFIAQELSLYELKKLQQQFISKDLVHDTVFLEPKDNYDVILHTSDTRRGITQLLSFLS